MAKNIPRQPSAYLRTHETVGRNKMQNNFLLFKHAVSRLVKCFFFVFQVVLGVRTEMKILTTNCRMEISL